MHVSNVPNVVGSCIVLYNICEIYGDHFWEDDIEVTQTRSSSASVLISNSITVSCIRDAIRDYL